MVVAAAASFCSERTKSREAGTAKCVSSAARSAHCSKKTSLSGSSQSTWTACEMQPGSVRERCTCSRLSLRTSSKVSFRAVTLPVTTIILRSPCSWGCASRCRDVDRLLRPALQRGAAGVRQLVHAAFGAIEPAIDIMQEDLSGIGNLYAQVAHALRAIRQRRCARQRLLAIGGHDGCARAAADGGIADAFPVLGDEARALLWIAAWRGRRRLDDHLDIAAAGDGQHAETEPPAQITITRVALATLALRREFCGKPHLICGGGAIDRLQDQFEIE